MKNISVLCLAVSILCLCLQSTKSGDDEDHSGIETSTATCAGQNVSFENVAPPKVHLDNDVLHFIIVVIAMVSILSNVLIIHVVRVNPHMRTTTNCLIVNMACGDLIATLISSIALIYTIENGSFIMVTGAFGEFLCKFQYGLFYVSMLCSVFSFVAITIDRFLAVTRPLKYKLHSSWTKFILPIIWLASFAVPANLVYNKITLCKWPQLGKHYCHISESKFDAILIVSLGYGLPHVAIVIYMGIAYKLWTRRVPGEHAQRETAAHQTAKKVTRMIVCILVAFDISWCPVFIGKVFIYLYYGNHVEHYTSTVVYKMLMISNGTSNALIYAIFNENFRRAFKQVLICKLLVSVSSRVQNVFKAHKANKESRATNKENLAYSSTTGSPVMLQRMSTIDTSTKC